ncbi:hypothetical protein LEP1GSC188_2271 [Leptospira weilii serovar Topaz str. LT2116]|uniref:Uncharacterized protein n=1 Tax=Leptospira weilii serovar Topaz str. LT2116 TaxID=1088540 RepID=M3FMZ2_9LEPT|nr:hypothetical protein LEP1GSC188_2271 [Leptospira weilii serovar Topaz str. LT2116]
MEFFNNSNMDFEVPSLRFFYRANNFCNSSTYTKYYFIWIFFRSILCVLFFPDQKYSIGINFV